MAHKRNIEISGALGFAAALAVVAWVAGMRIQSPADAAARTAPPTPSSILVPVENRVLSSKIVTRGSGRYGLPQPISVAPSVLKPAAGLITRLPLQNTQFGEGAVMFIASGRPVFLLRGKMPAYRDLVPGLVGDDVRQLEEGLQRLGYDPGPADGTYDQQTSAAVARWYKAKGWEPFAPTREQTAAIFALERDWGEASKAQMVAGAAVSAAALTVESARATAEHSSKAAASDLGAKKAELLKFIGNQAREVPLAVESERAKAEHANAAAAAEVAALTAERAVIALDPRQTETARASAEAKLEMARAAQKKTKLDGELAVKAAERDAQLANERLDLAESAFKSASLDAEKTLRAALDAQKVAQFEAKLASDRAERLSLELDLARSRLGVQVPVDEIVFVPSLPVRVEELKGAVGGPATGLVMTVTDNRLAVDSSLDLESAPLVKPGMPVEIDEQALGVKAKGVVETVASTPGTRGVDGYHVYFEVRVTETSSKIAGVSVRLTIPTEATSGSVTAVPISALSLAADGTSRVQVQNGAGELEYVVVQPGLAADGYVAVTPVNGTLSAGQLVVVGYKSPEQGTP
jgi:peptidoglycan hydrolase-like protein with peptidoglycan-binding domain